MRKLLGALVVLTAFAFGQLVAFGHTAEIKQHTDLAKGFMDTAKTHVDLAATQTTDAGRKQHVAISNDALKEAIAHLTLANQFASDDTAVLPHTQQALSFAQEAQKHADLAAAAADGAVAPHVDLVKSNTADSALHMGLALGALPSTTTERDPFPAALAALAALVAALAGGYVIFRRRIA